MPRRKKPKGGSSVMGWDTSMSKPNPRKISSTSFPSLSVRIDLDTQGRIGPGKIQLLENIHSCGSISAAGRAMKMPYKRAWTLVEEINGICRRSVVESRAGGKDGGDAVLTPFGLTLVERYRMIERSVENAARKELIALYVDISDPSQVRHTKPAAQENSCA
jgi:molybdate transport system regulatory protein